MFHHLEVKDGLSDNLILDIHRDSQGYMWFATASGLNRYDGVNVKTFFGSASDPSALPDSYIKRIQEDADGRLWLQTGGGYAVYDPATEAFVRGIPMDLKNAGVMREPDLVYIDNDKNVWYYLAGTGCYLHRHGSDSPVCFAFAGGNSATDGATASSDGGTSAQVVTTGPTAGSGGILPEGSVSDMAQCAEGILLAYNNGLLVCFDPDSAQVKWTRKDVIQRLGISVNDVFTLFVDRDDDIWVYSAFGVWTFGSGNGRPVTYSKTTFRTTEGSDMVHAVAQDGQGRIWLGRDMSGIVILDKASGEERGLCNLPDDSRSLQNNSIMSLCYDSNDIMWVGTYKKGVSYYNESAFKFGLKHLGDVNCIEEDAPGCFWCGTNDEGLFYWDSAAGKITKRISKRDGLGSDAVVCLLKASDGKLWIGTFWGGLHCYEKGRLTRYSHVEGQDNSLISNNVWSLVEAPDGSILIGTLGGGIQKLDPRTGRFSGCGIALPSTGVMSMCLGKDNELWIGTDYGLCCYNLKTGQTKGRRELFAEGADLSNNTVNHIFTDSRGLVWIGTRDGLDIYNPRTGELTAFGEKDGMPSPLVAGICEDDNRTMWVTMARGVLNIIPVADAAAGKYTYEIRVYDDRDGTQSSGFNHRSIKKSSSGEIYMGGLDGINFFNPDEIKLNKKLPNVIFTKFSLFNEEVAVGAEYNGRVVLEKALNMVGKIVLKYEQNIFSVSFVSDDLILPDKTTYFYRLDGFNDEWIATDFGKVTYTNLSPGSYKLRVKASGSDGYCSDKEAVLEIVIRPPFARSGWAVGIYLLVFVLILLLVAYIIKRVESHKFELQQERQAAEHDKEVNDMKLRFFTNVSHELRTPLTLIVTPLESLIKEYSSDDELQDKLKMIQRNVTRLSSMVTQLLDFRKSEVSGHHLHLSEGEIVSFISGICDSFLSLADGKDVHLTFFSAMPSYSMAFDEDKIGKVVNNLLSNAFKFTPRGGRVDVAVGLLQGKAESQVLEIKVSDTGIGVKDEDKKRIFERFYQADRPDGNASGSGIGLNLVRDFVDLHGGSVSVLDNVPQGAVFIVYIPVKHMGAAEGSVAENQTIAEVSGAEAPAGSPAGEAPATAENPAVASHAASPAATDAASPDAASVSSHAAAPAASGTILVVDDNDDFLTFMYDSLSKEYNVTLATNGKEAWEMILQSPPDIIISDVMMPEMDGNELCRLVKGDKRTSHIPIILLTARHSYESRLEGLTVGADDYMTKPFSMDIMELRIRKFLEIRKEQGQRSRIDPSPSDIEITSLDEKLIERGVKYVEENMGREDLSVEQLSRELGMSRVNLYKKLLAITGKTPIVFIRTIRLKRAAQLLRESQLNVSEVAYQVGFNSTKYFNKYFKEEFGMSPSSYRESSGTERPQASNDKSAGTE